jgi:hypothetical protein
MNKTPQPEATKEVVIVYDLSKNETIQLIYDTLLFSEFSDDPENILLRKNIKPRAGKIPTENSFIRTLISRLYVQVSARYGVLNITVTYQDGKIIFSFNANESLNKK